MAQQHKGGGKRPHPASEHLRKAADALDAHHNELQEMMAAKMGVQPQQGAPAGPMPGVSPLGGQAR